MMDKQVTPSHFLANADKFQRDMTHRQGPLLQYNDRSEFGTHKVRVQNARNAETSASGHRLADSQSASRYIESLNLSKY